MRIPGALLPAAGLAVIVVAGQLATLTDATAELATPLAIVLAVAGLVLGARGHRFAVDRWALLAAAGAFAAFGAPVLLSGEATFTGYVKLDDTATWLAITDRVMEHGRDLSGLAPSSYEATLDFTLGRGYPIGAFIPLGVGAQLAAQDPAWVFQPYVATLGAILALGLFTLGAPLIRSGALRAGAAFLAAQPALLFGYSLWGGAKEMVAAALLPAIAALAAIGGRRALIPLAIVAAALVAALSVGGVAWVVPPVAAGLLLAARDGVRLPLRFAVGVTAIALLVIVPALVLGGIVRPWARPLLSQESLGLLLGPLSPFQIAAVWPSGDFRLDPDAAPLTVLLIAVVIAAAVGGITIAFRSRARALLAYALGTLVACGLIAAVGSPWVDAKALAIASPALAIAAVCGAAAAIGRRGWWRVAGSVALAAIAAGVLWSNALAYREVTLAPRAQLEELAEIGELIAGEGPTLITEHQPYGTRHFLRDAAPEGSSELRRSHIELRDGTVLRPGRHADIDELEPETVAGYPTLVLRRSPTQSRPPAGYSLTHHGEYYDVWQRRDQDGGDPLAHRGLGTPADPVAVPPCGAVLRLARLAGPRGRLVAATRPAAIVAPLTVTERPPGWETAGDGVNRVVPRGGGVLRAPVRVPRDDRYALWVGGSVRSRLELAVDGELIGEVGHRINNSGQHLRLGDARLGRGAHVVTVRVAGSSLRPGSGGQPIAIGPVSLTRAEAPESRVVRVGSRDAKRLCGSRWDWIEAT